MQSIVKVTWCCVYINREVTAFGLKRDTARGSDIAAIQPNTMKTEKQTLLPYTIVV